MGKALVGTVCALLCCVALVGFAMGERYSAAEQFVIATANDMLLKERDEKVDEEKYIYSVGRQVSESEFVSLDSNVTAEEGYEDVVVISALNKQPDKEGEIVSYSVTYNSKTKSPISINVTR